MEALGLSASDMRGIRPNSQLPSDAYVLGNIENLNPTDLGRPFDLIFTRQAFPYCADPAGTIARTCNELLAPDGLLVVDQISLYGVGRELVPFLDQAEALLDLRYCLNTRTTNGNVKIPSLDLEDLVIQRTAEPFAWPLTYNGVVPNQYTNRPDISIATYSFCG